jgi:hypothetical protein
MPGTREPEAELPDVRAVRIGELVCSGLPLESDPERPGRRSRVGLPLLEDEFLRLLRTPGSSSGEEIYQDYASHGPLGDLMDRSFREVVDAIPRNPGSSAASRNGA